MWVCACAQLNLIAFWKHFHGPLRVFEGRLDPRIKLASDSSVPHRAFSSSSAVINPKNGNCGNKSVVGKFICTEGIKELKLQV